MTEATEAAAANEENPYTKEAFEALQADNLSMKGHMDKLLGEAKTAKNARRETEEAARLAEEEANTKNGNFEQLHKSSMEANELLKEENNQLKNNFANNECKLVAASIANDLAEGQGAELLKTHILPHLKYVDGDVKILDSNGQLTVSSVDEFKSGLRAGGKYDVLLKGNQSTGGGATGGKSGSAVDKVMSRADFDKLDPGKQMKFVKSGGKTID